MSGGEFAQLVLDVGEHVSEGEVDATSEALLVIDLFQPVAKHLIHLWLQNLTHLQLAQLLLPQNGQVSRALWLCSKSGSIRRFARILSEDIFCVRSSPYLQFEVVRVEMLVFVFETLLPLKVNNYFNHIQPLFYTK